VPDLKVFATNVFGGMVDKYSKDFQFVKDSLPLANMKIPFRIYMSWVFLLTIISFVISAIITVALLSTVSFGLPVLARTMLMAFLPFALAGTTFVSLAYYPTQKMNSRTKDIESNLPFALTHMGAVAESGVPPYVIFKLISEFQEYGEISKEMKKITRNIETFGLDPLTAVKEAVKKTPSEELKQTLMGFVTTTESGGDLKLYLKSAAEQALFTWRIKREKFLQQLSMYAEFYTGVLIAAPLFLVSLFAVMALIQPNLGGLDIITLTQLSIYGLIPAINVVFLVFLKGMEMEI
jgi:flagellar protein FlaJ